jgi:hypothetical protein
MQKEYFKFNYKKSFTSVSMNRPVWYDNENTKMTKKERKKLRILHSDDNFYFHMGNRLGLIKTIVCVKLNQCKYKI